MLSPAVLLVLPTGQNVCAWGKQSNMFPLTLLLVASVMLTGLRAEVTVASDSPPACASCVLPTLDKDAEERLMIEVAKQQILSKLNLKERPNITHTVPRVALLTALRKLQAGRVRQDGTLMLDHSLPTREQGYEMVNFAETGEAGSGYNDTLGLVFQFVQEHGQNIQVLQASLWLYARSSALQGPRLRAQVFLSADPGASNRTLLTEKMLYVQESNWHTFTITRPLQGFLDRGHRHLHLEVSCRGDDGGEDLCSPQGSPSLTGDNVQHRPFLVAKVRHRDDPSKHSLRKRSLRCGEDVTVCCKRNFYIKFKDIQWQDWIIAPEGYHMNYCMGQCPQHLSGSPGIASSFHATVFSQLKINGINTAVSSCCVPTERRPLSMMYFNSQHNIVKMDVPDMIVESCGCT